MTYYTTTINMEATRAGSLAANIARIAGRLWRFAASGLCFERDNARLEQTFAEAIRLYDTTIRRICFGYARTPDELEDLHQDALINIWQGLPKFRADSSLKTWIYRVTLNSCVSVARTRNKELNSESLDALIDVGDDSEETRMRVRELHECISTLRPLDKAIVMLWLEDYSYDEIADMTGLKRNNVATRLHRAKSRLKTLIDS